MLKKFNSGPKSEKIRILKSEEFSSIVNQSSNSISVLKESISTSVNLCNGMENRVLDIKKKLSIERLNVIDEEAGEVLNTLDLIFSLIGKLRYNEDSGEKGEIRNENRF